MGGEGEENRGRLTADRHERASVDRHGRLTADRQLPLESD